MDRNELINFGNELFIVRSKICRFGINLEDKNQLWISLGSNEIQTVTFKSEEECRSELRKFARFVEFGDGKNQEESV